jgi:cyclophilin type peptidyl-prolyl cis-trans isomerase/CLD
MGFLRNARLVALTMLAAANVALAQDLLKSSPASDWRALDPENTIYMELPAGRVVIELAPAFAPANVAAIRKLVREKYFDGSAIIRSQDNYVVQWARPDSDPRAKVMAASPSRAMPGAGNRGSCTATARWAWAATTMRIRATVPSSMPS